MSHKRLHSTEFRNVILISFCLTLIYLYWFFNYTVLNNTEWIDLAGYALFMFLKIVVPIILFAGTIIFYYIFRTFRSAGKLSWLLIGILNFISCIILCSDSEKVDPYITEGNLALIAEIKCKNKEI
jgi:hypothetical protein